MRFYSLGQLNNEDKNNILQKHREVYNGYKKVWQPVANEQPLYIQDFANDKVGVQVDNLGNVSSYNNKIYMKESKEICSECGKPMTEGECMECGKSYMDEDQHLDIVHDIDPDAEFDFIEPKEVDFNEFKSAFSDEIEEEINMGGNPYSEVDPAYDFVSGGPMREDNPEELDELFYDTSNWDNFDNTPKTHDYYSGESDDVTSYDEDLISKIRKNKDKIEDIDFEEIDEDIKESFLIEKNKINEMFDRFSRYN